MRRLCPALGALLAACAAAPAPEPAPPAALALEPEPAGLTERLAAPASIARARVERLAARCWLDAELAAEVMLVDRRTGEIVAAGAVGELLRIGFQPTGPLETEVRLAGPALDDRARAGRLRAALARALEGAEPAC